jgi:hypothetical protein
MIDIQPLSPRAARAISSQTNHVLATLKQIGKSMRERGVTVSGNYLINNVMNDEDNFSPRVRIVAEAAAYLMSTYDLELMGWASFGRGGLVLGKGDVPMLTIGTAEWGRKPERESLAIFSDAISRDRGSVKNVCYGGSITSLIKRVSPEVFDPNTYTFLSDEVIRIMAEAAVASATYRKKTSIDYSSVPAEDMFRLIDKSVTGIVNFAELDVANPIRKWFDGIKEAVGKNEDNKGTHEEIKAHMKKGFVCVVNMNFGSKHVSNNVFGLNGRKYSVLVFRPDEFGVMKYVSRKNVESVSDIEYEYPHIASAYHLRKIEAGHDKFDMGYSEAYGCTGFSLVSTTSANKVSRNYLMRSTVAVFPETMYIEKGVVTAPTAPTSSVDSIVSTLEF